MATDHVARQVFDLPEPKPLIVTEHRAHGCRCTACGTQTRAAFPEGVAAPVQYGKRIEAFVLYLLHYQLLPEKRLATLMNDLFGVRLVTATIARISQDCAHRLMGLADTVREPAVIRGADQGAAPAPMSAERGSEPLPITAVRSARLSSRDRRTGGALDRRRTFNVGLVADFK
jgi:hypothetical protein